MPRARGVHGRGGGGARRRSRDTTSRRSSTSIAEAIGPAGRWIHFGLTSSDVIDTGFGLQLRSAADVLLTELERLLAATKRLALQHRETVIAGRSHGVIAEPTSFGHKLAVWAFELDRDRDRLRRAREIVSVGAISGAVGTYASVDPRVEELVCAKLGLRSVEASTQVIQRDRHAELMTAMAITASTLDKIATEIRHLARTEVREVQEPFAEGQKGSSAMPHKRNPVVSERISGLARVIRGHAQAALENVALWHERDISHSSAERLIFPDATGLLAFMLRDLTWVLDGLRVFPERMRENLEVAGGVVYSQSVLLALVAAGLSRDEAYALVQSAAAQAWDEGASFRERLVADPGGRRAARHGRPRFPLRPHAVSREPRRCVREAREAPRGVGHGVGRMSPTPRLQAQGKVRDIYDAGDEHLLLVATDRISAFDVVLPDPIPDKGRVLTGLSSFWFDRTADLVPHHVVSTSPAEFPAPFAGVAALAGRAMLVRKAKVVPMECVARGYLAGSGWIQYGSTGSVCGVPLPDGLVESDRLPEPIFTPTTKAEAGHDLPLTPEEAVDLVGQGSVRAPEGAHARDLRASRRRPRPSTASSWRTRSSSSGSRTVSCS